VPVWIQGFKAAEAAVHGRARGWRRRVPTWEWKTDRLAEMIQRMLHATSEVCRVIEAIQFSFSFLLPRKNRFGREFASVSEIAGSTCAERRSLAKGRGPGSLAL
jgi:hypothetical protein